MKRARQPSFAFPRGGNGDHDPANRSYWMADAMAAETTSPDRPGLREQLVTDVCVVGDGYTGLWTAIELKRRDPGLGVVLVEAGVCGAGASGANAGIAMNLWPKFSALVTAGGVDEAVVVARESEAAVAYLSAFCDDRGIDAQVRRTGWLWASTNPSQDSAWSEAVEAASRHRAPFEVLDADRASQLAGTYVRGGVLDPTCAHLHPGRLVRGLAQVAADLGVGIYEHSPVTTVGYRRGDPVVRTQGGSVRASSVVLAINAWAVGFTEFRRHLVMTASDDLVVDPGPERPAAADSASVSDSGRLLDYWRPLADGKVLFGKAGLGLGFGTRGATSMFRPAPRRGRLRRHLTVALPHLADATVVSTWRAPVEYSLSSLPFFTQVPNLPRVYCGTGYSGDGVGPSILGGRILASLAAGVDDELSTSFLTKAPTGRGLPPEPVRFVGGQVVKAALLRRDRLEDQDRRVDPVTRVVSNIDPTVFAG